MHAEVDLEVGTSVVLFVAALKVAYVSEDIVVILEVVGQDPLLPELSGASWDGAREADDIGLVVC